MNKTKQNDNIPVVFKIAHNPRISHSDLKALLHIPENLTFNPIFYSIFQGKQPIICYKRTKNIKELLDKPTDSE